MVRLAMRKKCDMPDGLLSTGLTNEVEKGQVEIST
jgi:hypothetical protein